MDLNYTGMVLGNNQGKLSIFITDPMGGVFFYRGENGDFPRFKASFQRDTIGSWKHCKKYIQRETFLCWYTQTPYYKYFISKKFMGGDFLLDKVAIAQHYGFATNYLDITCKREIAEFFAYTYYDDEKNMYLPLEKFDNGSPCLYTGCGGNLIDPRNEDFIIIGFQVLTRPMWQYAFAIDLTNPHYNYNTTFHKTSLPEDKQKAKEIYDKFLGGELIFPKDIASNIQIQIERNKCLNRNLFNSYCNTYKIKSNDKSKLKISLENEGYYLGTSYYPVNQAEQKEMQKEIDERIIPWINEHIQPPRLCCKPI